MTLLRRLVSWPGQLHRRGRQRAVGGEANVAVLRRGLLTILWSTLAVQPAFASWSAGIAPMLAEESSGSGASGVAMSILDWGIVVVLVGFAVFAICRTSRRN